MRTAATADVVAVELVARTAQYDAAMARSAQSFDRNMNIVASASRHFAVAAGLSVAAIGGVAMALRSIATSESTQTFQRTMNSLRATGLEGKELTATFESLLAIANRQYQPIEALGKVYRGLSLAQKDLKANSSEMLEFTERVAMALRIQGTSAIQARGALLQLTQAMSGVVRAEEFNSIREGALPLVQAAANAIKEAEGSVGKLKNLVDEGKISSQAFFRAVLEGSKDFGERLASQMTTAEQAQTRLANSFVDAAGKVDAATGATAKYVAVLNLMTGAVEGLGNAFAKLSTVKAPELGGFLSRLLNLDMGTIGKLLSMAATLNSEIVKGGGRLNTRPPGGPSSFGEGDTNYGTIDSRPNERTIRPFSYTMYPADPKTKKRGRSDAQKEADWWENQAEQYEKAILAQERQNRKIEEEIALVGLTAQERDKALIILKLTEEAKKRGVDLDEKEAQKIAALAERNAQLNEQLRQRRQLQADIRDFQQQFGNLAISSIEGLVDGSKKLNDVLGDTLRLLARMALQAAILGQGPLAGLFGTSAPAVAGGGQGIGGLMGGLFGGMFAGGGPTPGNKPIITGEKGPELWLPGRAGSIVKNSDLVGSKRGGGLQVVMQNDFRDSSAASIAATNQRIDRLERNLPQIIANVQTQGRNNNPFFGS
jgi:tape measure domain-containing protein